MVRKKFSKMGPVKYTSNFFSSNFRDGHYVLLMWLWYKISFKLNFFFNFDITTWMWAKYCSKNRPRRQVNILSFIGGKYCAAFAHELCSHTIHGKINFSMQIFFKTSKVGEIRSYLSYFAHIFKKMISGRSSVLKKKWVLGTQNHHIWWFGPLVPYLVRVFC